MAKKKNVVARSEERRDALLKSARVPASMTEKQREIVVALLEEGATLSEITTIRGIASHGSIYRARAADPIFDDRVRNALAQGAAAAIAEANQLSKQAAKSGNPDDMRVAEAFHRCALAYAEKVAPRDYGQLIKLGGHDGGALALSVVNYALPAIEGKFEQVEGPRAREAIEEELDAAP